MNLSYQPESKSTILSRYNEQFAEKLQRQRSNER